MRKVRTSTTSARVLLVLLVVLALCAGPAAGLAGAAEPGDTVAGVPVQAAGSAVVNMADLAAEQAAHPLPDGVAGVRALPSPLKPAGPNAPVVPAAAAAALLPLQLVQAGPAAQAPSPGPAQSFAGLGDIRDLSNGYLFIPPDTDGAVGYEKIMSGLNNNYRIFDKATGAPISTVGIEAFWGLTGDDYAFDPKTLFDPIHERWIVVALGGNWSDLSSSFLIGVSQTSDPSGAYYIYSVNADPSESLWADFPTIGFDDDYVAVNVNMFTTDTWEYSHSRVLTVDYKAMASGTWRGWFLDGSSFTSSPAATYSHTVDTLYVPTQPYDQPGVYQVDTITGDPDGTGPLYTVGELKDRGVMWSPPDGNILPQKPTLAVPDPYGLETQDDMIRSTPVMRDGAIYYTQTVGFPEGRAAWEVDHTSILWTKLDAATGDVADGGLIDDPTATATNGGSWYSYPHIAVNKFGDIIVGFSEFSSAIWPSAAYAVHKATDAPGTMRDPVIYKAGEDLYQKDFGSGRYRWGDYSKAQVDPSNDTDLWVLNEYSVLNDWVRDYGGVWGTWWAKVASPTPPVLDITAPASPVTLAPGDGLNVAWTSDQDITTGEFGLWARSPSDQWYFLASVVGADCTDFAYNVEFNAPVGTGYHVILAYRPTPGTGDWGSWATSPGTITVSDGPLPAPALNILEPLGFSTYASGDKIPVVWTSDRSVTSGEFGLWARSGAGTWYLGQTVPATGVTSYSYDLALSVPSYDGYHIIVAYRPTVGSGEWGSWATSPGTFVVVGAGPPMLQIHAPAGSHSYNAGDMLRVVWISDVSLADGTFGVWMRSGAGDWYLMDTVIASTGSNVFASDFALNVPPGSGYQAVVAYKPNGAADWVSWATSSGALTITDTGLPYITNIIPPSGSTQDPATYRVTILGHNLMSFVGAPTVTLKQKNGPGVIDGSNVAVSAWLHNDVVTCDITTYNGIVGVYDVIVSGYLAVGQVTPTVITLPAAFTVDKSPPPAPITVTAPTGEQIWNVGDLVPVTWVTGHTLSSGEFGVWARSGSGDWYWGGAMPALGTMEYWYDFTLDVPPGSGYQMIVAYRPTAGSGEWVDWATSPGVFTVQ